MESRIKQFWESLSRAKKEAPGKGTDGVIRVTRGVASATSSALPAGKTKAPASADVRGIVGDDRGPMLKR